MDLHLTETQRTTLTHGMRAGADKFQELHGYLTRQGQSLLAAEFKQLAIDSLNLIQVLQNADSIVLTETKRKTVQSAGIIPPAAGVG